MAQAFLETDFLVRRAPPAPVRNAAQTGSRPAFTLDDPKPDPAEVASPSRDTRGQAQRTERDRPDAPAQSDRTNQARIERPAAPAQSRSDAPAAKAKAATRADAASSDDIRVQVGGVRRDRPDTPAPTIPQASSETTDAGTAQVEASLSATDETEDETDVSEAPVQDQDASLLALGLLPAPPPITPKAAPALGQASASLKQGPAGQIQGGATQSSSAAKTTATDQAHASSGAVQAQKGAVSAATGQDAFSASDIDGTNGASALQATASAQPVAGTAPPSKDAASGAGDPGILTQAGASDAVASDPTQLGQAVPATSAAQPSKDEPPAAGLQAILAAPGLSEAAKSGSKPAGSSVATKGAVQLSAAGQAPKGGAAGTAEQEAALAPSGAATLGKLEASPVGKSDPAVAVQEAAGGKDAAVSVAVLPTPDAPQHQVQDSFSAHLAGASIGSATTLTAGASAPTAPAAHTAPPASPPVPLGAVPMTIGLRSLQGSNHFEIRLDPGELGRIDVKLDIDKERGTVMAHLVVDRIETLALLQRDAGSLQQALSQAGLEANEANINLSLRSDAQSNGRGAENQGSDGRSPEGRPGHAGASHQPEGRAALDAIPMRTLTGLTGLDIRI